MSKKQILILCLAVVFIAVFAVSCTVRRDRYAPDNGTRQTRFTPGVTPRNRTPAPVPRRQMVPGISPAPGTRMNNDADNNSDMTDRAEKIADRVSDEKEIDSATCIISGNTAMVGVQFDDQYKGKLTDRIKRKVEKAAKQEDKAINRVIVTADPDIVSRIEDMFEDLGKGRPISGFADEINEMINRIQPK